MKGRQMVMTELLPLLRGLNRAEKLHVVQVLVSELAQADEATLLHAGMSYSMWSPHDAFQAAETMLTVLKAEKDHGPA